MTPSRVRVISWVLALAAIVVTLSAALAGILHEPILTFVVVVEGTLTAGLILNEITKRSEKSEIRISSQMRDDRLCFEVLSMNKTLKAARVRCNDISYEWEGFGSDRKDIFVGDEPSEFCPYKHGWEWVDKNDLDRRSVGTPTFNMAEVDRRIPKGGVLLYVKEAKTSRIVWQFLVVVTEKFGATMLMRGNVALQRFPVTIRLIAEGVEEVKEYAIHVELDNLWLVETPEGKPAVNYGLVLGTK